MEHNNSLEQDEKSANVADWLESRIHHSCIVLADDMFARGELTRSEWLTLKDAIGEALETFRRGLNNLADLHQRRPGTEVETELSETGLEDAILPMLIITESVMSAG